MTPFPTNKESRAQLFSEMKESLPALSSIMNTLKDQGYTSKVMYFRDVRGTEYSDEVDRGGEEWQVDDALMERVDLANRKRTAIEIEAKRKERQRVDAAKRKRSK